MRRFLPFVVLAFALGLFGGMLVLDGCTPAERQEAIQVAEKAAPTIERVTCVVLRTVDDNGTTQEVCATADELVPFIDDIVKARADAPVDGGPMLAVALPVVQRRSRHHRSGGQDSGTGAQGSARADYFGDAGRNASGGAGGGGGGPLDAGGSRPPY